MTAPIVKIGVAGAGGFTELWYLPILKSHPDVCVKAICSPGGKSARKLAIKFDIPVSYSSYMEMIDSEKLDGICIVTPNKYHYEIAFEAMKRNIHVMCEKPLAMNSAEALLMRNQAIKNSVIHGINFTYRENPAVLKLKELLDDKICGNIFEGLFQYIGAYGLSGPPGWRGSKSKGGSGGVLADLGSHLIDLVQYILGEKVSEVQSSLSYLHDGKLKCVKEMGNLDQSPDSVSFLAGFPSGIRGSFYTSWISPQGNRNQTIKLTFVGDKGSIQLLSSELGIKLTYAKDKEAWKRIELHNAFKWDDTAEPSEDHFRPWRLSMKNEIWKWAERIKEGKKGNAHFSPFLPDFNDGYNVQRVIDAVIESAVSEKKIRLNYDDKKEE